VGALGGQRPAEESWYFGRCKGLAKLGCCEASPSSPLSLECSKTRDAVWGPETRKHPRKMETKRVGLKKETKVQTPAKGGHVSKSLPGHQILCSSLREGDEAVGLYQQVESSHLTWVLPSGPAVVNRRVCPWAGQAPRSRPHSRETGRRVSAGGHPNPTAY
jgi:hypothetical protein